MQSCLKTLTGPAGSLLEYTYDADGKELSETTVTGEAKTYTYNAKDLVKSVTNGRKQTTSYEYDAAGRLVKTSSSQYTYDDENYRIKSGTEEYCYDRQNKNLLVRYAKDGSMEIYAMQ